VKGSRVRYIDAARRTKGGTQIMGDKSPKSTQKQAGQKQAKNSAEKKKIADADAAREAAKSPKK
jgi:hypothetical protein